MLVWCELPTYSSNECPYLLRIEQNEIYKNLKNYINFYQKVYEINETMIIEKKSEIDKFIEAFASAL